MIKTTFTIDFDYYLHGDSTYLSINITDEPCKVAEFNLEHGVMFYDDDDPHSSLLSSLMGMELVSQTDIENQLIKKFIESRGYNSVKKGES